MSNYMIDWFVSDNELSLDSPLFLEEWEHALTSHEVSTESVPKLENIHYFWSKKKKKQKNRSSMGKDCVKNKTLIRLPCSNMASGEEESGIPS